MFPCVSSGAIGNWPCLYTTFYTNIKIRTLEIDKIGQLSSLWLKILSTQYGTLVSGTTSSS